MPHAWCCQCVPLRTSNLGLEQQSKPAPCRKKSGRSRPFGRLSQCVQSNNAATTPVHAGTTPYGRGLVSCKQLSSGTRLLYTPFAELLLLPDKVEGPYEKVHEQFWHAHGSVPDELFRFITGQSDKHSACFAYNYLRLHHISTGCCLSTPALAHCS